MFRINGVKTQVVGDELRYHVRLESQRDDWRLCGILQLSAAEWLELLGIAEREHIQVGLTYETTIPAAPAEAAETR